MLERLCEKPRTLCTLKFNDDHWWPHWPMTMMHDSDWPMSEPLLLFISPRALRTPISQMHSKALLCFLFSFLLYLSFLSILYASFLERDYTNWWKHIAGSATSGCTVKPVAISLPGEELLTSLEAVSNFMNDVFDIDKFHEYSAKDAGGVYYLLLDKVTSPLAASANFPSILNSSIVENL